MKPDESLLENAVIVPYEALSAEALRGVVEEFVMREGTDYGAREVPADEKTEQVLEHLRKGQAVILFDPASETCTIARREEVPSRLLRSEGSSPAPEA